MSAFSMNVSSDKQTLILAGEAIPPRRGADASRGGAGGPETSVQLQRVAMLLVLGDYAAATTHTGGRVMLPSAGAVDALAVSARALVPYPSSNRALAPGAAEYARTRNLSGDGTRSQLIDTYA
jgi:hypothetical protein